MSTQFACVVNMYDAGPTVASGKPTIQDIATDGSWWNLLSPITLDTRRGPGGMQ